MDAVAAVPAPQHGAANPPLPPPPTAAAAARKGAGVAGSIPRLGPSARRKTLCDITNMRRPPPPAEERGETRCDATEAGADSVDGVAQLVKENSDLVRLLEERDKIILLSGNELQKLRFANWQLAQANSQMLAEINLGRNKLKVLQHELVCSRAAIKAKTSELEEAKKAMKRSKQLQEKAGSEMAQPLGCDKAAQMKDGDVVVNPEPASDAAQTGSVKKLSNAGRKRMQRSRSLGPAASVKLLAVPKEKESVQRRKSMRPPLPQPDDQREDLFELEDVELTIGSGCKTPRSVSCNGRNAATTTEQASSSSAAQFLRRSSLGRPIRGTKGRVASYKDMPVNIKLRRP